LETLVFCRKNIPRVEDASENLRMNYYSMTWRISQRSKRYVCFLKISKVASSHISKMPVLMQLPGKPTRDYTTYFYARIKNIV